MFLATDKDLKVLQTSPHSREGFYYVSDEFAKYIRRQRVVKASTRTALGKRVDNKVTLDLSLLWRDMKDKKTINGVLEQYVYVVASTRDMDVNVLALIPELRNELQENLVRLRDMLMKEEMPSNYGEIFLQVSNGDSISEAEYNKPTPPPEPEEKTSDEPITKEETSVVEEVDGEKEPESPTPAKGSKKPRRKSRKSKPSPEATPTVEPESEQSNENPSDS